jgi:DNA-binding transcriptional ArsR family regulator
MLIKLSKQEIRALGVLCTTSLAIGELAKKLSVSPGMANRLAKSLEKKALIDAKDESQSKILSISFAQHAQTFKRFYETRPDAKIEEWLAGPAIELLILISNEVPLPLSIIEEESSFSRPTLFRKINQLKGAGVISSSSQGYTISDPVLRDFAIAYANTIHTLLTRQNAQASPSHSVSIRVRKHVIRRLDTSETSSFFIPTGLTILAQHGLEYIFSNKHDYYFNLDEQPRKISVEEAFIHALLLSTIQPQDTTILVIALDKVHMSHNKLSQTARKYLLGQNLRTLMQSVEYHKKLREYE